MTGDNLRRFTPLACALFVLLHLIPTVAVAAAPEVANVRMQQRTDGSRLVDIHYDLADADGDTMAVSLRFSDDGGATWDFPVLNCSGDIGQGVVAGTDRHIVWDLAPLQHDLIQGQYQVQVLASDVGVRHETLGPRHMAITDFGIIDFSDPANIEKYARADLVQLKGSSLWRGGLNGDIPVIAQMKAINPDIVVVGYVPTKVAPLYQPSQNEDLFYREWYEQTLPYPVYTTEGAVAQDWYWSRLINVLDPECRRVMISLITEFQNTSLNQFDGIYWDYFNTGIWVPWDLDVPGDPDFDGDGIGHGADDDERQAFRASQVELVSALRDSLGEDFIQIFNGQRAYTDSTFASLADGVMYELFPTLSFPDPDMTSALDPEYTYSLFAMPRWLRSQNGGPFMVLENKNSVFFTDGQGQVVEIFSGNLYRAVALLLDGAYSSWNSHAGSTGIHTYGWPEVEVSLGQPLGPATFEGDFIRRDFRYGQVELQWRNGTYPDAFNYWIWAQGQLVEMLNRPMHYP
jgi:hypothetical protein